MSGPLKIGFLGVEHYHANFWAEALKSSEHARIAGVWDKDAHRAAEFATRHAIPAIAARDRLLAACDAVAICSATSDHVDLIEAAADAGLAILCEKPLAATAAETARALEILGRHDLRFMQSFPKRLDPATLAVRDIVAACDLGDITLIRIRHGHSHGLSEAFRAGWYTDPALSGGGTLLDEGIHAADFLRQVFGEPAQVWASVSHAALGLRVEDTALALFEYENGPIAEVATGWCFAAADASIEVFGTEGTLILSGVDIASRPTRDADFLRIYRGRDGEKSWESIDLVPYFKAGVFHEHVAWTFVDCLVTDKPFPTDARDGARAFAMIDAAYRSASTGQRQKIGYPEC